MIKLDFSREELDKLWGLIFLLAEKEAKKSKDVGWV